MNNMITIVKRKDMVELAYPSKERVTKNKSGITQPLHPPCGARRVQRLILHHHLEEVASQLVERRRIIPRSVHHIIPPLFVTIAGRNAIKFPFIGTQDMFILWKEMPS
jgi:hypothetical protein